MAQRHDAAATNERSRTEGFGIDHAVVGRIGLIEHRETLFMLGPGEFARIDDGAGNGSAMAAHVFGQCMNDNIRTVLEWTAQCRRRYSIDRKSTRLNSSH